jgi:hypothetical protein
VTFARLARCARQALVNGAAGFVVAPAGRPLAVAGYTVAHRQIVEIDPLADPAPSRPVRHSFAGPRAGRLREAARIRDPDGVRQPRDDE